MTNKKDLRAEVELAAINGGWHYDCDPDPAYLAGATSPDSPLLKKALEQMDALKLDAEHFFNLRKQQEPSDLYSLGRWDTYKWVHECMSAAIKEIREAMGGEK